MKHAFALCALLLAIPLAAFDLVRSGHSVCSVSTPGEYSSPELNAAQELCRYLQKITGAEIVPRRETLPDTYPVRLGLVRNLPLPSKAAELAKTIRHDGFLLYADESGLYIAAREPRGVLFGAYETLREFGGVRWIYPGPDGEFLKPAPDFTVPAFAKVYNPSFPIRQFNLVSGYYCRETLLWMLRNKLQPGSGRMTQGRKDSQFEWAPWRTLGGHIFSTLLPDKYFAEHPDCFALVNGKRIPQKNAKRQWQAQPCASSSEGLRIMADSMEEMMKKDPRAEEFGVLNNDCGGWCECDACQKLGSTADRYWRIANTLVERADSLRPGFLVTVHSYQNFQRPPEHVTPDPRAAVRVCVHHRCYVHSIGDPACEFNARYREMLAQWKERGMRGIGTYEYTNCMPAWCTLPIEGVIAGDLKYYHSIGNDSYIDEVIPMDGLSQGKAIPEQPFRGYLFAHYIQARMLWDVTLDFQSEVDEAGALVYDRAWPAMKKFRDLYRDCYIRCNQYFGYGSGSDSLARVMEQPGAKETLLRCLDEAMRLALPGSPSAKQIAAEKAAFEHYYNGGKSFAEGELPAGTIESGETPSAKEGKISGNEILTGEARDAIVLDGADRERSWFHTDYAHGFRLENGSPAASDTWIKFLFSKDSLYGFFRAPGKPVPGETLSFLADGVPFTVGADGRCSSGVECRILVLENEWRGEFRVNAPREYRAASQDIVRMSVVRSGAEKTFWNAAPEGPANQRRLLLGPGPRNMDFNALRLPDGTDSAEVTEIPGFGLTYTAEAVRGGAASGEYFVRTGKKGLSILFGDTIQAFRQTYEGKLGVLRDRKRMRFSAQIKGHGTVGVNFRTTRNGKKTNHPGASFRSETDTWHEVSFEFDASLDGLFFITLHGPGVSIDDIHIRITE